LAKALLHNPRLIILDEPANGLDPAGIVEIREQLINMSRTRGVTVVMSRPRACELGDGLEDGPIAGAAAEVAGQLAAHGLRVLEIPSS
jgi:ABC-type protease/lipase transport system fused ATPase/permease subunit